MQAQAQPPTQPQEKSKPVKVLGVLAIILLTLIKLPLILAFSVPSLILNGIGRGLAAGSKKISEKLRNNIGAKILCTPLDILSLAFRSVSMAFATLGAVLSFPFTKAGTMIDDKIKSQGREGGDDEKIKMIIGTEYIICFFVSNFPNQSVSNNLEGEKIFKAFDGSPTVPTCFVSRVDVPQFLEGLGEKAGLPLSD